MKIDIDSLALTVINELEAYGDEAVEAVTEAVQETAKETIQELRAASPRGVTGDYAESWKKKRNKDVRGKERYDMVVYSNKPEYRLTHLLENGHAKRNGGRVEAIPHIKSAEEHAQVRLENKIRRRLS